MKRMNSYVLTSDTVRAVADAGPVSDVDRVDGGPIDQGPAPVNTGDGSPRCGGPSAMGARWRVGVLVGTGDIDARGPRRRAARRIRRARQSTAGSRGTREPNSEQRASFTETWTEIEQMTLCLRMGSIVAIVSLVVLAGCGDSRCIAGATQPCVCSSGASGTQVCGTDERFGPCECGGSGLDGSIDASTATDSGLDGSTRTDGAASSDDGDTPVEPDAGCRGPMAGFGPTREVRPLFPSNVHRNGEFSIDAVQDFNGDGHRDIMVTYQCQLPNGERCPSAYEFFGQYVILNDGSGAFRDHVKLPWVNGAGAIGCLHDWPASLGTPVQCAPAEEESDFEAACDMLDTRGERAACIQRSQGRICGFDGCIAPPTVYTMRNGSHFATVVVHNNGDGDEHAAHFITYMIDGGPWRIHPEVFVSAGPDSRTSNRYHQCFRDAPLDPRVVVCSSRVSQPSLAPRVPAVAIELTSSGTIQVTHRELRHEQITLPDGRRIWDCVPGTCLFQVDRTGDGVSDTLWRNVDSSGNAMPVWPPFASHHIGVASGSPLGFPYAYGDVDGDGRWDAVADNAVALAIERSEEADRYDRTEHPNFYPYGIMDVDGDCRHEIVGYSYVSIDSVFHSIGLARVALADFNVPLSPDPAAAPLGWQWPVSGRSWDPWKDDTALGAGGGPTFVFTELNGDDRIDVIRYVRSEGTELTGDRRPRVFVTE